MSTSFIRIVIVILTLFTAGVHGIVLNQQMGHIDPLFTLNAIGYLVLLGALIAQWPTGRLALVHYAFIGFTAVTVIAWLLLNGDFGDPVGVSTKAAEVLLIVFLYLHLKRPEVQSAL
jgi:hypothetical protein